MSNTKLKLAKNQANAKQHHETDLFLFENYSYSSSTLSSKNNKTCTTKQVKWHKCRYSRDYTISHNENGYENEK